MRNMVSNLTDSVQIARRINDFLEEQGSAGMQVCEITASRVVNGRIWFAVQIATDPNADAFSATQRLVRVDEDGVVMVRRLSEAYEV